MSTPNCQRPDANPDDWFPSGVNGARITARRLCGGCQLAIACARIALDVRRVEGIWAGVFVPRHGDRKRSLAELERIAGTKRRTTNWPIVEAPTAVYATRAHAANSRGEPCLHCRRAMTDDPCDSGTSTVVRRGSRGLCAACARRYYRQRAKTQETA